MVKQISKITHRAGKTADIPESLEEFEFGVGEDSGRVFVGLPNLQKTNNRRTFPFRNTELLTEHAPNVEQLLRHIYQNRDFSQVDPLGAPRKRSIVRTLTGQQPYRNVQEVLDERMSVQMFGAKGDGSFEAESQDRDFARLNAETFALRNAVIDASNNQNMPTQADWWHPKRLYWPAGVYVIYDPLFLPPYSDWVGDGPENTVIYMINPKAPCVAHTVDGKMSPEDIENIRSGADAASDLYSYHNIDMDYAPQQISVSGITFKHIGNKDVIHLMRAHDVVFSNCRFEGAYELGSKPNHMMYDHRTDSVSVRIDGLGGMHNPHDISFEHCTFSKSTYAFMATDDIMHIDVTQSRFEYMYRAVSVGEDVTTPQNTGFTYPYDLVCPEVGCDDLPRLDPRAGPYVTLGIMGPGAVKVDNSWFYKIQMEGFAVFRNNPEAGASSMQNTYSWVGEDLTGVNSGEMGMILTSPIFFAKCSRHNSSIGDTFSRLCLPQNDRERRVWFYEPDPNLVVNPQDPVVWTYGINLGGGFFQSGMSTVELLPEGNDSKIVLPREMYPLQGHNAFVIEYSLDTKTQIEPKPKRIGSLYIVTDGEFVDWWDNYVPLHGHSNDIELEFRMRQGKLEMIFKNNSGLNYEFRWSSRSWNTAGGIFGPGYGGVYGYSSRCGTPTEDCKPGPCDKPCS